MIQVIDIGVAIGEYVYNGNGQRVKKIANGLTTIFHYGLGGQLIAESDNTGIVNSEYVYLFSQPLAKIENDNIYIYHNDHLGTPMMMTDGTASTVWEGNYLPFGEEYSVSGSVTNNIRFPGQYYDKETGLHYNYYRDYNPMIGRYVEADPIGIQQCKNHLYGYVGNNPISWTDPMGLWCIKLWSRVTGSWTVWRDKFFWESDGIRENKMPPGAVTCVYIRYQKGWQRLYTKTWYLCCEKCSCSITSERGSEYKRIKREVDIKFVSAKPYPDEIRMGWFCPPAGSFD